MDDLTHPEARDRTDRPVVALRLTITHDRDAVAHGRGRQVFAVSLPPARVLAFIMAAVLVAFAAPVDGTLALLSASTENPANAVQANTVRLAVDGGDAPAFVVPALMPGETVDRAIGIRSTGTGDARIDLAVMPEASSALVAGGASGLSLSIDRCTNGIWATTTPGTGVPTPPPSGAKLACVATPGAVPSVQAVYGGPIVPRGVTAPGAPTSTPQAIPLIDRLGAGDRTDVRVRVSLPEDPAGVSPPENRQGGVTFEWRATGLGMNLVGTPLAGRPMAPVTATATAFVPVAPSATATSTAVPTSTLVPTATATASATATVPAYAGYALAFDGMADAMQVGWTQAVGPLSGRSAWTFEAWVNPADLAAARVIYAESSSSGDTLVIRLGPGTSGGARLEVGLRHGGAIEWTGADLPQGAVVAGAWSHLGVAFIEGTRLDLAVNGLPVTSATSAAATTRPDAPATDAWIARPGGPSTGAPFAGAIDEVRAWSLARTYAATDATFLQKLAGGEPGLVAHFPMSAYASTGSDARGAAVLDQSGNGLTGTILGGGRWIASRAPVDRPATPHGLHLTTATDAGASTTDGITNLTAVAVTGRASAGSMVTLWVDGTPVTGSASTVPTNGTFEIPVTLGAGARAVSAVALDGSGMTSMAAATATFIVDTTAPVAGSIAQVETGFTLTGASDAGYAGAGVATVQLQVATGLNQTSGFTNDGAALGLTSGGGVLVARVLPEGVYSVRFAVTDVAGNVADTAVVNVVRDTAPPTVGEVQRQLVAETTSTWNAPRYTVTATDATSAIASVVLQVGASATGPFTDSGSPVTQPYSGSIYVVPGPVINGTQWVRMRVTDLAGNEATSPATMVTTWDGASANADWTTGGSASFSAGYLILTPDEPSRKGGAYFESLVPSAGQVSVSFDLEVDGSNPADGVCVPFFSSAGAFLTGDSGGSLGCMGMAGTYFVGISEYHGAIEIGTPVNGQFSSTPASGFANTTSLVRFTIILTPTGGSTTIAVQAQVGAGSPSQYASRTMPGTLPAGGTLVAITGATGGQRAEHKVRNIVISGS